MDKKLLKIIKLIGILISIYLFMLLFPIFKSIFDYLIVILMPFIIGFFGAYILYPITEKLTRLRVSYKASVIIVVSVFLVILIFIGVLVIPKIIEQLTLFIDNLPNYILIVSEFIDDISIKFEFLPMGLIPNHENINNYISKILENRLNNINKFVEDGVFYFLTILISPILIVYFLLDFKKIMSFIKETLIKYDKENIYNLLIKINQSMRAYFNGVIIVMFLLSIVATVAFRLIGIQYSLLWGVLIGITNIIPYIGPYIGGFIVVGFTLTSSVSKALSVLIVIIILQLVESNFITPNIQSKMVHTNPILVLLFISLLGKFFGILGMIFAIPILCIIQILLSKK